jgi:hypothetical protein
MPSLYGCDGRAETVTRFQPGLLIVFAAVVAHEERGTVVRRALEIAGAAILFLLGLILFLVQL